MFLVPVMVCRKRPSLKAAGPRGDGHFFRFSASCAAWRVEVFSPRFPFPIVAFFFSGLLLDFSGRNTSFHGWSPVRMRSPTRHLSRVPARRAFIDLVESPAGRASDAHIVVFFVFFGFLLCLQIMKLFHDHGGERDRSWCQRQSYLPFVNDTAQSVADSASIEDYALPPTIFYSIGLAVTFLRISWRFSTSSGIFHDHQEWVIVRDVTKKLCHISLDHDTESSQMKTCFCFLHRMFLLGVCFFFEPISLTIKPVECRTLLSSTSWSVTLTSAWIRSFLSCYQAVPPCSKKLLSGWRWSFSSCLHPRRRSKWLFHQWDSIRCR